MGATELTSHLCAHLFTQARYEWGKGKGGGKLKRSCLIAEIWSVRSVALLALCVYRELFKFYHTYLVCGFYLSGCAKLEDPLSRAQQLYKWSSIYHIVWLFVVIIVIIISIIVGVVCGVRVLVLVLM